MSRVPRVWRAGTCVALAALSAAPFIPWLQGCAHVAAPRGGPPDTIPPSLIAVQPDSYSVIPDFEDDIRFRFDESISERGIERAAILYPFEPRPRIDKGGQELRIRPRRGWVTGRIYHVVVDSTVQDLFDNRIERSLHFVFSTGPEIPGNRVEGRILDRITGERLGGGRFDMVQLPDTLRYGTVADTGGRFRLATLPTGDYLAIGYEDRNRNLRADAFDRSDTTRVSLGAIDTVELEFRVFKHDTVAPTLSRAEAIDSMTLSLEFDGYLDPDARIGIDEVRIVSLDDGSRVALDTVFQDWEYRSLVAARRRAEEAADTLAPPDTVPPEARPDTSPPAGPAADTAAVGPDQDEIRPLPARRLVVRARAAIPVGAYRVTAREIPGLNGLPGGGEVEYEQPAQEPPDAADEGADGADEEDDGDDGGGAA